MSDQMQVQTLKTLNSISLYLRDIRDELSKMNSKNDDFKSVDSSLGVKYYGTPGWNNNNMKCNCVEDDCKWLN